MNTRSKLLAALGAVVLLVAGIGIGVAIGHRHSGSPTTTAEATGPVATPAAASPAPTPTPVAGPAVAALGTTVHVPGGMVTVYSYRQPVAADAPKPDQSGYVWGAAEVKVCLTEADSVSTDPWTLVYSDDSSAEASNEIYSQFPLPEYSDRDLGAGRCQRGWITFPVPRAERPTMVEYTLSTDAAVISTTDWNVG